MHIQNENFGRFLFTRSQGVYTTKLIKKNNVFSLNFEWNTSIKQLSSSD